MRIEEVAPPTALPDGLIRIRIDEPHDPVGLSVMVGGEEAEVLGASSTVITVKVPVTDGDEIEVTDKQTAQSAQGRLKLGRVVSSELHPVANPVVDASGNVFVTFSGTRGEKVAFGVFLVDQEGETQPFLADITNPTGLAIGPDDCLYVTSRHSGEVFRSTFDKQVEKYAEGLGLATGLAFDSQGNLFVGDRGGNIYRVERDGQVEVFCELEPSVSAFHIAVDRDDCLYVTGPTLATQDSLYRVSPDGSVETYFRGLGRPQGIGFDPSGRLQVAASFRGRKGLYTFVDGMPQLTVAGPMLVGFVYSRDGGHLFCVDNSSLYRVDLNGSEP